MTSQTDRDPEMVEALAASTRKLKLNAKLVREIEAIAKELRRERGDPHRDGRTA